MNNIQTLLTKPEDHYLHTTRRAFFVIDDKIVLMPENTGDSHLEWLQKNNIINDQNFDEKFPKMIRGFYWPETNSLYFYWGVGFYFDDQLQKLVPKYLSEFQKLLNLSNDTKIFLGPKDNPIDGISYPQKYFGTITTKE